MPALLSDGERPLMVVGAALVLVLLAVQGTVMHVLT